MRRMRRRIGTKFLFLPIFLLSGCLCWFALYAAGKHVVSAFCKFSQRYFFVNRELAGAFFYAQVSYVYERI